MDTSVVERCRRGHGVETLVRAVLEPHGARPGAARPTAVPGQAPVGLPTSPRGEVVLRSA